MDDGRSEFPWHQVRRALPWLHIFAAFRIALDIRKMLLAAVALMLLAEGDWLISQLPFAPETAEFDHEADWPSQQTTGFGDPLTMPSRFVDDPTGVLFEIVSSWKVVLRPVRDLAEPLLVLFRADVSLSSFAHAWTKLLWMLLVWALFGGAVTRMSAVQFARDEHLGMRAALKFSASKFVSYVTAPLFALAGISLFWLICFAAGVVGRIPFAGDAIVGGTLIVSLVFGLIMSLILVGGAAGWPMMYAAISAEGSDAFDGFSRPYSYVFGRTWQYAWNVLVALVYGSISIFFVTFMATLVVYLTGWAISSGMGADHSSALFWATPALFGGREMFAGLSSGDVTVGSGLAGMWLHFVSLLVIGFVYSYFWTASTLIYFLLRLGDDATELDEVYIPEEEQEEDSLLPLVGVAGSMQPVVERPLDGDAAAPESSAPETGASNADADGGDKD